MLLRINSLSGASPIKHCANYAQLLKTLCIVQEKKFQAVIDKTFPLAETRAAQRYLEGREHFGKVMLTM